MSLDDEVLGLYPASTERAWNLFHEMVWLDLLPGWDDRHHGPQVSVSQRLQYARALYVRAVDFSGEGDLDPWVRGELVAALRGGERGGAAVQRLVKHMLDKGIACVQKNRFEP